MKTALNDDSDILLFAPLTRPISVLFPVKLATTASGTSVPVIVKMAVPKSEPLNPSLSNLPLKGNDQTQLDAQHLANIKAQIDLVLLALEALTGLGSEAMLQAAEVLGVEGFISDRVALWRLRQSNPMRKGSGGRKKLDVEEARSLVLISCHLAQSHQSLIREAVTVLESLTNQNLPPHHSALLGDYITKEELMAFGYIS